MFLICLRFSSLFCCFSISSKWALVKYCTSVYVTKRKVCTDNTSHSSRFSRLCWGDGLCVKKKKCCVWSHNIESSARRTNFNVKIMPTRIHNSWGKRDYLVMFVAFTIYILYTEKMVSKHMESQSCSINTRVLWFQECILRCM